MEFIPNAHGWFNIQRSINVIHHINRLKKKTNMIISINAEKAFDKIQHPFMIKTLRKLEIEGNSLNSMKNTTKKLTAYLMMKNSKPSY